ncbi:MAG: hypothetical protein M1568_04505 [Acidobacteria bacterium]|nr:hypothetical protein [Acidobacteriota bacterium]
MSLGRTLKSYVFWTYERGSIPYDIMVTLILAFIFITPHLWHYGDQPQLPEQTRKSIVVHAQPDGTLIFDIPASRVKSGPSNAVQPQLEREVLQISGAVTVDRIESVKDSTGHVTGYKLWAHR